MEVFTFSIYVDYEIFNWLVNTCYLSFFGLLLQLICRLYFYGGFLLSIAAIDFWSPTVLWLFFYGPAFIDLTHFSCYEICFDILFWIDILVINSISFFVFHEKTFVRPFHLKLEPFAFLTIVVPFHFLFFSLFRNVYF